MKVLIFIELLLPILATGYKPIVLIHGINSIGDDLKDLKTNIQNESPGTVVYILKYVNFNLETFIELSVQLNRVIGLIKPIMKQHEDGIHLICHSQGGLLCLGLLETISDHNIESFISLSAPLNGQFGLPDTLLQKVPILKPIRHLSRELATYVLLTNAFQKLVSFANFWKDPWSWQLNRYEHISNYLPVFLNDPNSRYYNETEAVQRKKNLLRIKQMVLLGGPQDGVIIPWQSAIFGYYDQSTSKTSDIFAQKVYTEDWNGLKTLDESSRLHIYTFENITHGEWHSNKTIFDTAIKLWLN